MTFQAWMAARGVLQVALGGGAAVSIIAIGPAPTIISPKPGEAVTQAWIQVSGMGVPGKSLTVFDGDRVVAQAIVKVSGKWNLDASFVSGKHAITAAYDQAGGISGTHSRPVEFVVKDLLKPLERRLEITNATDGATVAAGAFALRGTAAPGRRIQVTVNNGKAFIKTAEEDGSWVFNLYLEKGSHIIELQTEVEPKESVSIILNAD